MWTQRETIKLLSFMALSCQLLSASAEKLPLGINCNDTFYASDDVPLKNWIHKSGGWQKKNKVTGVIPPIQARDSDGYAIDTLGLNEFLQTYVGNGRREGLPLGDWVLTWKGNGTMDVAGDTISNKKIASHRVTFRINGMERLFTLRILSNDATDHVRDVRLLEAPYEGTDDADPIHPAFLKKLRHFNTFRLMWYQGVSHHTNVEGDATSITNTTIQIDNLKTPIDFTGWVVQLGGGLYPRRLITGCVLNGTSATLTMTPQLSAAEVPNSSHYYLEKWSPWNWAERRKPTEIVQSGDAGMALEYQIAIFRQMYTEEGVIVNPWFNIPTQASDDYVLQMAKMVKQDLFDRVPGLKAYIEYSNETWGYGFGYDVANSMGNALNIGNTSIPSQWAYHAFWASQIFDIWSRVLNEEPLRANRTASRIVRVLASQIAVYQSGTSIMDWGYDDKKKTSQWPASDPYHPSYNVSRFAGHHASEFADALAGAPYFDPAASQSAFLTKSPNEVLMGADQGSDVQRGEATSIEKSMQWVADNLANAQKRGLQFVQYEGGGPDSTFSSLTEEQWQRIGPFVIETYNSPLVRTLELKQLNLYDALGHSPNGQGLGVYCVYNFLGGATGKYGNWAHATSQFIDNDTSPRWLALMDYLNDRRTPMYPNQLIANPVNDHQIQLRWTDNSLDESGFVIERKNLSDGTFGVIARVTANATGYLDSDALIPDTIYTYRVQAFNDGTGSSEYSNEATARTATVSANIPESPYNLVAAPFTTTSIRLRWFNSSSIATAVIVQRKKANSADLFTDIAVLDPWISTYIDADFTQPNGPAQTYRVIAAMGPWRSAPSNEYTSVFLADWAVSSPQAPSNLQATVDDANMVHLQWKNNAVSPQTYVVQRATDTSGPFVDVFDAGAMATEATDTPPATGLYYYRIKLINANASTSFSAYVQVDIHPEIFYLPAAPINLSVSMPDAATVRLNWIDMSDNESNFVLERKSDGEEWAPIITYGPNITAAADLPAVRQIYFYRVRAVNTHGFSNYSNEVTADLSAQARPAAPEKLQMTTIDHSTLGLTWVDDSWNETTFRIERRTLPDGDFAEIGQVSMNQTSFADRTAQPSTYYEYRVRAGNSNGFSDYSRSVLASIRLDFLLPATPVGVAVHILSPNSVRISWETLMAGETGFVIERNDGTGFLRVGNTGASVTSFEDLTAIPGTAYLYRVASVNTYGTSTFSDLVAVSMPALPSGSNSGRSISKPQLSVLPPVVKGNDRHVVVGGLPEGQSVELALYDQRGKRLLSLMTNGNKQVDVTLPDLAAGVHFFSADHLVGKFVFVH